MSRSTTDHAIATEAPGGSGVLSVLRLFGVGRRLSGWWLSLTLNLKFAITTAVVVAIAMTMLGAWVANRIVSGTVQTAATNAALYLVSMIEPHAQELARNPDLSPATRAKLDAALSETLLRQHKVIAVKLWAAGGKLAYASNHKRIGQVFEVGPNQRAAWLGGVGSSYDRLDGSESELERGRSLKILEVYAPVRDRTSDAVIAVAEIYEEAAQLATSLNRVYLETVGVLTTLAIVLIGSLYHLFRTASRTIETQHKALAARVGELSALLSDNKRLQWRVSEANQRAAITNERLLRDIGAELHDGPAQLIGLGLLRLDALKPNGGHKVRKPGDVDREFETVRGALGDALKEIRSICNGIALPELRDATLVEAVTLAVRNHERRTGTIVATDFPSKLIDSVAMPLLTSSYRFVQEGLNNAYRHAGGRGQAVTVRYAAGRLELIVPDAGNGILEEKRPTKSGGLGLSGLKDRIEALGGQFIVETGPAGTRLRAVYHTEQIGSSHA